MINQEPSVCNRQIDCICGANCDIKCSECKFPLLLCECEFEDEEVLEND